MARVLVIEDHELVHRYLCEAVRTAGYRARCVRTKAEGEAELASGGIDLVVCDIRLPDGSGNDIAARAAAMGIKTILMTGHPDTIAALASDQIAHLRKPFRLGHLMKLIEHHLAVGGPGEASARGHDGLKDDEAKPSS